MAALGRSRRDLPVDALLLGVCLHPPSPLPIKSALKIVRGGVFSGVFHGTPYYQYEILDYVSGYNQSIYPTR